MNTVERAAEVIDRLIVAWPNAHGTKLQHALRIAQALADAGWHDGPKLSGDDRAVLDAADAETTAEDSFIGRDDDRYDNEDWAENQAHLWLDTVALARERRRAAVRARRETRP